MTRIVVTAATIALLTILVGCQTNQGLSQRLPNRDTPGAVTSAPVAVETAAAADEIDVVEQLASHRQAYRQSLETLIKYYDVHGNRRNLEWARTELQALDRIPQYRYIIEAEVMPKDLRATEQIQAADDLYQKAVETERKAGVLPVLKDENVLRVALNLYGQLISQYPTSDKIDDAAWHMAGIHEYFRDFVIALSFYQRVYQWDPSTPYPARFKAAWILDDKLHRRAEALELYQESVVKESQHENERAFAERRIRELSTTPPATAQ
jgi:tetratricopeptide (TPR) repeat protein